MATKIINSMSFITFARTYGPKTQLGGFSKEDPETKQTSSWQSIICTNAEGDKTYARLSPKLGTLKKEDISRMKAELQCVQLESGNWTLCKVGENSWEDIDLGI